MTATLDLRRATVNLRANRGDEIALPVTIREGGVNADLTGRTYTAALRRFPTSTHSVPLTVDLAAAAAGQIILRLDDAVTVELEGAYDWSLVQTIGGTPRSLIGGTWTFS